MNSFVGTDEETGMSRFSLCKSVNPEDLGERSLTRHLTTSERDPNTGIWTRPVDHKDDLLKALVFCEMRFYLEIYGGKPKGGSKSLLDFK